MNHDPSVVALLLHLISLHHCVHKSINHLVIIIAMVDSVPVQCHHHHQCCVLSMQTLFVCDRYWCFVTDWCQWTQLNQFMDETCSTLAQCVLQWVPGEWLCWANSRITDTRPLFPMYVLCAYYCILLYTIAYYCILLHTSANNRITDTQPLPPMYTLTLCPYCFIWCKIFVYFCGVYYSAFMHYC